MLELERDADGHVTLAESSSDAKVRTLKSTVHFAYIAPTRLDWRQEKGELKSVDGAWELEELGEGRTRATYRLDVELGRMLGMVIRGPLVGVLRGQLVAARAGELKQRAESRLTAWAQQVNPHLNGGLGTTMEAGTSESKAKPGGCRLGTTAGHLGRLFRFALANRAPSEHRPRTIAARPSQQRDQLPPGLLLAEAK